MTRPHPHLDPCDPLDCPTHTTPTREPAPIYDTTEDDLYADDPCHGTGTVPCWNPGGPCPPGQAVCELCGPCLTCNPTAPHPCLPGPAGGTRYGATP